MEKLGLTLREILRYGYAGCLMLLICAIIDGQKTKDVVTSLGDVMTPLVVLAVGAGIYSSYKPILCDKWIAPYVERLNDRLETEARNKNLRVGNHTLNASVRDRWKVPEEYLYNAFRLLRDKINRRKQEQLHTQNAENHIAYVSSIIFVIGAIAAVVIQIKWLRCDRVWQTIALVIAAVSTWFSGRAGQISIARQTYAEIWKISDLDGQKWLAQARFIPFDQSTESGATS